MPMDDAGVDAAVEKDTADSAATGREAAAASIPLADEPLKASVLQTLADLVPPAIERLTKGQMPTPKIQPIDGDMDQVPADLGQLCLAVSGLVNQFAPKLPALKPYVFSAPDLLTSNDGLTEMGSIIDSMSRDPEVLKGMDGKPPVDEPEAEVVEEEVPEEEG